MRKLSIALLCVLSVSQLLAQETEPLKVKVTNIKKIEGYLVTAVYDKEEVFLTDAAVTVKKVKVDGKEIVIEIPNLPEGKYANTARHSNLNNNGSLDSNFMKIPKEPYGFSNNRMLPSYQKSAFRFPADSTEIEIRLR